MTRRGALVDGPAPRPAPSSWGAGVVAATGATMTRPGIWPVALVGLLVRGGLVPFALPIVVLPTTTGLATALGPAVISLALGQPNAEVARLAALAVAVAVAWLIVNALVGAWTDAVVVGWIADELGDRQGPTPIRLPDVLRVALARAAAHLPLLVAAGWGAARLVAVTRDELIMPGDLAVPIVLRVIAGAPEVVAVLVLAWLGGEALGELAARSVLLERASASAGLARAAGTMVVHLPAVLATLALGTVGLVVLVLPPMIGVAVAWAGERGALGGDGAASSAVLGAVVLSVAWSGTLVLAALGATWRSALWTAEVLRHGVRRPISEPGTVARTAVAPPAG